MKIIKLKQYSSPQVERIDIEISSAITQASPNPPGDDTIFQDDWF